MAYVLPFKLLLLVVCAGAEPDINRVRNGEQIDAFATASAFDFSVIKPHHARKGVKIDATGNVFHVDTFKMHQNPTNASNSSIATNASSASTVATTTLTPAQAQQVAVGTLCFIVLVGFQAFVVGLAHLAWSKDPDIRFGTWTILSGAMSLGCVALLFNALQTAWDDAVGANNAAADISSTILTSCLLLVIMCLSPVVQWFLVHYPQTLAGMGIIIGNLLGFAAMQSFSKILNRPPFNNGGSIYFISLQLCAIIYSLFMIGCHFMRVKLFGDGEQDERTKFWKRQVERSEEEGFGITFGFLISVAARLLITGAMPDMQGTFVYTSQSQIKYLWIVFWVCMALNVIAVYICNSFMTHDWGNLAMRIATMVKQTFTMTTAWCGFFAFRWSFTSLSKNRSFGGTDEANDLISAMCVALMVSFGVFVTMYALDFLGDIVGAHRDSALREVNLVFAFLVGYAWQMNFFISIEKVGDMYDDPRVGNWMQAMVTLLICFVTLPAWFYVVLPKVLDAEKDPLYIEKQQKTAAAAAKRAEASSAATATPTPSAES